MEIAQILDVEVYCLGSGKHFCMDLGIVRFSDVQFSDVQFSDVQFSDVQFLDVDCTTITRLTFFQTILSNLTQLMPF